MAGSRYCGSQNLKGNEIIHEENVDHFAFRSNVNRLVRAGDEISSSQAYMMTRDAEIALAKSAAPASISDHATIKVLTNSGFEVAHEGENGFACFVMRGFTGAPTFTPVQFRMMSYDPHTV